jgi:RHS repeat-associated protein
MVSEAFGKTFVDATLAPTTTGTTTNNLRFPGQYEDQETGTYYNYFRDYEPSTARYIQSDPLGVTLGRMSSSAVERKLSGVDLKLNHLYAYVDSSPLSFVDPEGLQSTTLGGRLWGGALGGGARGALGGGLLGALLGAGIGSAMSTCEPTARDRCERACDRDYDFDQKQCEAWWKTTGRNPSAYQSCMRRAEENYVACYQDCGKQ